MPLAQKFVPQSSLIFFDAPFSSPPENLACDEALLDWYDASHKPAAVGGVLRFWESRSHFVVLGYGKKTEEEIHSGNCARLKIPILRRCTGGGTVLQGPGCLNYTLVLPTDTHSELATITGANRAIMERMRGAVEVVARRSISVQGFTDLTVEGRKFSGNAQRRKKRALLFHGSILLNFDLHLIGEALRPPLQQPEYRAGREHGDFLVNLQADGAELATAIRSEWNASVKPSAEIVSEISALVAHLVETKYTRKEWNERS